MSHMADVNRGYIEGVHWNLMQKFSDWDEGPPRSV